MLREGCIVDAIIISAHSREGNQLYFRVKMQTCMDDSFGMIYLVEVTAANEQDLNAAGALLNGDEARVFGDSGYRGIERLKEHRHRNGDFFITRRSGVTRQLPGGSGLAKAKKIKASVRAKVEHPFRTIKRQFGYAKVCYRSLAKNTNRPYLLTAFNNMLIGERYLPA